MLQIPRNAANNPLHNTDAGWLQDAASTVQTKDSRPTCFKYHANGMFNFQNPASIQVLYKQEISAANDAQGTDS